MREIKQIVVSEAVVKDVYGMVDVYAANTSLERVAPAKYDWIDIPPDYVRPKTVTIPYIYKIAPRYEAIYEPYKFRDRSFDTLVKLDGRREKVEIPAIYSVKTTYKIDPESASSRVEEKTFPYDPETMEKDGKVRTLVTPPQTEYSSSEWISKRRAITHQTRTPGVFKEVWGDCIETVP